MKNISIAIAFLAGFLTINAQTVAAQANSGIVICRNTSSGQLVLRKTSCPSGEARISRYAQLKGADGTDVNSLTLAAGKVSTNCTFATKIAGSNVTTLTCEKSAAGTFVITVRGTFHSLTSENSSANRVKVVVSALPNTTGFTVESAVVTSASSTRIVATIKTNKADSASLDNDGITFSILNGSTPAGGNDSGGGIGDGDF